MGLVDIGMGYQGFSVLLRSIRRFSLSRDQLFWIAGDADGDGNPSAASPTLAALGGQDLADLGGSEAIQIEFDWNSDGVFDTIAGIPTNANAAAFAVAPDLSPGTQLLGDSDRFGTPPVSSPLWVCWRVSHCARLRV